MRAVVVGAGGLGSYVGAALARAGHEVHLVARGAHAEAIRGRGLTVRSVKEDFVVRPHCVSSAEDVEGVEVALVAVKAYSLEEVGAQLAVVARAGAAVLPLLNGVDATERLQGMGVPGDRLVDGVAYLTAFRTAPGEIDRKGTHQRLVVGSSSSGSEEVVERVVRLFRPSSIQVEEADDIEVELWEKMAVVCSLSVICCLSDAAVGPIRDHPLGGDFQARAIAEVLAVGRGRGVALPNASEASVGAVLDAFPRDFYPSVLHDLRSGRRTEMDALAGVLTRMGRKAGVETPLLDAATVAVALEEERRRSGAD